jgi:trans-aconitate methyltransferase
MSSDGTYLRSFTSSGEDYRDAFRVFLDHTDQKKNALAWLDRAVSELPARGTLIDAGAGNGVLAARLSPQFARTIAIEPNRSLAEEFKSACPQAELLTRGILDALPAALADFIVCSHVFYYIERGSWADYLRRMAGWLQPRGVLAVTIQNADTDCMRMLRAFTGVRYDLAELGERFLVGEGGKYRAEIETVPAEIMTNDMETAVTIAEFMLNLTPLANPPLRTTVESYIVREFLQPNGNYRISCDQDFLRVCRA